MRRVPRLASPVSVTSQTLPCAHPRMFILPQPQALGEGLTLFDWDVGGQKSYTREEWLPGIEEQVKA